MSAIIPITANKIYLNALKDLARELNVNPSNKDEYAKLCKCFMSGWKASKDHTFEILKSIEPKGDDHGK